MKHLILLDTHAIIHRAYHALPVLTNPAGEPVHAVYGFSTILMRILRELKPDYIAAAFDLPGPTFRHVAYERYKAQRPETPGDLASQFDKVREMVRAFGIPIFEKEGYVTASLVQQYAGIEESEATKRLKSLSKKYKWKTKQDPQKLDVVRYSPGRVPKLGGEQSPSA